MSFVVPGKLPELVANAHLDTPGLGFEDVLLKLPLPAVKGVPLIQVELAPINLNKTAIDLVAEQEQ
jgi:hypothetical protein